MRKEKWGVYAPFDCVVVSALFTPSNYGNRIYLKYPDNYHSIHAHLSRIFVTNGQEIKKGQLIGIMGDTGVGTKHLHFGLVPPCKPLSNLLENCVNPVPWLVNGGVYPCNTKVSGAFQEWYGSYFHEGIDFSGREANIICGWENGIMAHGQRFYV